MRRVRGAGTVARTDGPALGAARQARHERARRRKLGRTASGQPRRPRQPGLLIGRAAAHRADSRLRGSASDWTEATRIWTVQKTEYKHTLSRAYKILYTNTVRIKYKYTHARICNKNIFQRYIVKNFIISLEQENMRYNMISLRNNISWWWRLQLEKVVSQRAVCL